MSHYSKNIKVLLVLLIIVSLGVILSIFLHNRLMSSQPGKLMNAIKSEASVTINNVRQTAMRNGIQEWALDAESALLLEADKKAVFRAPRVIFFMGNDKEIFVSAEEGVLWTDTNDIDATGKVIVTHKNYRLKTEKLHYRHKNRIISSDESVELSGDLFDFKADTMMFTLGSNETRLEGNVEGTLSGAFSL